MGECECVALDALPREVGHDGYTPPLCRQPAVAEVTQGRYVVDPYQACRAHAGRAVDDGLDVEWYAA